LLGPKFVAGRDFAQKAAVPGHSSQIRLFKSPRVHGLPVIICQSGFARIGCAHRARRTRRVDTYQQRWRAWCVRCRGAVATMSCRGRLRAPFYPASRPRRNCSTARLYKDFFCDVDRRLLSFLSIGSDGAYYFPVQVLHELFFMIYIESSWKTYGGGICFYIVD